MASSFIASFLTSGNDSSNFVIGGRSAGGISDHTEQDFLVNSYPDILVDIDPADMMDDGFILYYEELAEEPNVKSLLTPPENATQIFLACGE